VEYSSRAFETEPPHAIASKDKSIHLWDTVTGLEMLHPRDGHKGIIRSLSFAPDGRQIASGADTKEGVIRIWNTKLGDPILPLST
jgi:WD40 repeat protein